MVSLQQIWCGHPLASLLRKRKVPRHTFLKIGWRENPNMGVSEREQLGRTRGCWPHRFLHQLAPVFCSSEPSSISVMKSPTGFTISSVICFSLRSCPSDKASKFLDALHSHLLHQLVRLQLTHSHLWSCKPQVLVGPLITSCVSCGSAFTIRLRGEVLGKWARRARAEYLVKCSLMPVM